MSNVLIYKNIVFIKKCFLFLQRDFTDFPSSISTYLLYLNKFK